MAKRYKLIEPDYRPPEQLSLFGEAPKTSPFPPILRDEAGVIRILEESWGGIGIDLEYTNSRPTILGVANDRECAGVPWDSRLAKRVILYADYTKQPLVAYSGLGADRPVLEAATGLKTVLEMWEDPMIAHYLTHMELCKAPGKGEDEDDTGALGMMNLWSAASFATVLPQWKVCRGSRCLSTNPHPCPSHDPFGYCAVDAFAGLQVHRVCQKELKERGTPYTLYRELVELSEMCQAMQDKGVLVDMGHIERLEESADARKEALFPEGGGMFNPKSPKQILEWFKDRGITLKGTDRTIIRKELLREARKIGVWKLEELEKVEEPLGEVLDSLYRLNQYKETGKGLKAWFDSKWVDRDGVLHPRFIVTGTSTGRLASSKPNFQNVPARGFGAEVRRAVVARPGFKLLKGDKSQLELRMCIAPETKILTEELLWKRADCLVEGEALIGFTEKQSNGLLGVRYRRSVVESNKTVIKPSIEIQTDMGTICGAKDHYVVVYKNNNKGGLTRDWKQLKDISVGDELPFTTKPWDEETTKDAGYLAGIFDGEGWLGTSGVGFAQAQGEIADYVKHLLQVRGFPVSSWEAKATKTSRKAHIKEIITAGMWPSARFLGSIRPKRLLKKSNILWEGRRAWGGINTTRAVVLKVVDAGILELQALNTSERTYIANGFFSHNCLWLAGIDPRTIEGDAFLWLVGRSGGAFDEAARRYHGTARDIAKSVSHGGNYMEGFDIMRPGDFTANKLKEIEYGALRLYSRKYVPELKRDWEYGGGVVAFTGANLAERLFGNRTLESRKKALEIQEDIYFKSFPVLREWQMKVLEEVERTGGVRLVTGRFIRLPDITGDSARENAKIAVAIKGQGNSAEHIISVMLSYWRLNVVPLAQIHDELLFEIPEDWGNGRMREFLRPFMEPDWRLTGFECPIKAKVGPNWLDMVPVNLEES